MHTPSEPTAIRCGVIGLGAMGRPMAGHLAAAGLLAIVWNRTRAKAVECAAATGCALADTPAGLAAQCTHILTCVSTDADLIEVTGALLPGLRPGTLVIDTSTVSADSARAVAATLARHDTHFLDAPVSGGVEGARNAKLVMMVGGDPADLDAARPVLEHLAARIAHLGPVGAGQATKAVNQIMAAGINQAVTEALAFGEAQGLPMDQVVELLAGGAAGNWFLSHRGASLLAGDYPPGFRLALHHKDLAICQQMAEQLGVSLPIVEMTLIHYRRLMDAGFGDEDISALMRGKRAMFEDSGKHR